MAEFEDNLNALLSNQELMGQIMSLAQSFGGEGAGAAASEEEAAPLTGEVFGPMPDSGAQGDAAPLPDMGVLGALGALGNLGDLGGLFSQLGGGLDPKMLSMLGSVMQEMKKGEQDEKNMALLAALRPFLKEKRRAKIDQAIQLAKLSRLARAAFAGMKGGESLV